MMTLRRVSELAQILRVSLEYNNAASAEVLEHVAIQLSMAEWDELKTQPGFFTHLRPDCTIAFHGIQITARVRFEVRA